MGKTKRDPSYFAGGGEIERSIDDERQVPPSGKRRLRNLTSRQQFMAGALFVVARLSFVKLYWSRFLSNKHIKYLTGIIGICSVCECY